MKKYVLIAALLIALSLLFGCVNYDGNNGGDSASDTINIGGGGGEGTAGGGTGSESSDAGSDGAGETGSGSTSGTETGAGEGTATGDSGAGTSDANAGETGAATDGGATTAPQNYTINIQNFAFGPAQLTIKKGDSVTWTNLDSVAHTATSDTGIFDSGALGKNASWSRTFSEAGTFTYHCSPHPYMTAKIIVE